VRYLHQDDQCVAIVWILFTFKSESDLGVTTMSWSFFYYGPGVRFECRGAVSLDGGSTHDYVDLFFYEPLWVGRGVFVVSVFGSLILTSDITSKVSLPDKTLNMVFEVATVFYVMTIFPMKTVISSYIPRLRTCLDGVKGVLGVPFLVFGGKSLFEFS
ncbi:hypothetical protein GW17_00036915, partial [Ensete ventricosum]